MRTDAPSRWFRMYAEFAHDPKVQMLSEADQRRYMMLLCMRCSNGDVTLHDADVTFVLRISEPEWAATKAVLMSKNLIDEDNKPTAWEKRQYRSDSSAERVSKHRETKKQRSNDDVTLQKRPVEAEGEAEVNLTQPIGCVHPPAKKPPDGCPPCPIDEIVELYHQTLPELPRFLVRNATRDGYIRSRWREFFAAGDFTTKEGGIECFRWLFADQVKPSKFLTGRSDANGSRKPFAADLEWLMRPTNFAKVIEGKYAP